MWPRTVKIELKLLADSLMGAIATKNNKFSRKALIYMVFVRKAAESDCFLYDLSNYDNAL